MAVPPHKEFHRPVLDAVGRVPGIVSNKQIRQWIKDEFVTRFSLSEDDVNEMLPSGSQTRFENRTDWAVSYLKRAGLLDSPQRAHYSITSEGREFLGTHPGVIEYRDLAPLIQMNERRTTDLREEDSAETATVGDESLDTVEGVNTDSLDVTPDEQMGISHRELNDNLADELLDIMKGVSPDSFERLVVRLLVKMGYGKGEPTEPSHDGGIDGIINQDVLGLDKVYIQAKRWQSQVGTTEIRNFSGSLDDRGATKGVFITTSSFIPKARQTAQNISAGNKFIRLIDGSELAHLMISHGVGVVTEITYEVKKLDENYFAEI